MVTHAQIRFRVDPADVPEEKAARRLHLTLERFREVLPKLRVRGFPEPDPDTGMYDLEAIDLWRRGRNPRLYGLTPITPEAEHSPTMGEKFRAAQERKRHDPAA